MQKPSSSGHTSAGLRSKKAEQEQATIVWVDEAGFYLLPMAVRTWAPRGQTPVLRVPLTRDHLIFHQWHYDGWATVPASAPSLLHGCRGGRLPARAVTQDQRPDSADL